MNIKERITKNSNLAENDSLSSFDNHVAQQNHYAYEIFYNFLNEVKPKRILEIGTALGGFTRFLKSVSDESNLNIEIRTYDIINLSWYQEIIDSGIDLRVENIFSQNFDEVKEDVINFINSEGITIVLCDGGFKIGEFNILSNYIKNGDFIMAHDYAEDLDDFEKNINGKIWNWCEITEGHIIQAIQRNNLKSINKEIFKNAAWVCKTK